MSFNAEPLPERFIQVHSDSAVTATITDETVGNLDLVALNAGENASLTVPTGTADILIISATRCERVH